MTNQTGFQYQIDTWHKLESFIGMAGHNFMPFIDLLDIQKHQVCHCHQAVKFSK